MCTENGVQERRWQIISVACSPKNNDFSYIKIKINILADWFRPISKNKTYDMRQNKQVLNQLWLVFRTADSIVDSSRFTMLIITFLFEVCLGWNGSYDSRESFYRRTLFPLVRNTTIVDRVNCLGLCRKLSQRAAK